MAFTRPRSWDKKVLPRIIGIILLVALLLLIVIVLIYATVNNGTGFDGSTSTSVTRIIPKTSPNTVTEILTYQPGKTLWDWLQLLIVPAVLALAVFLLSLASSRSDQKIASQRYQNDQEIALDKQREDLLQTYLDRVSGLLIQINLSDEKPDQKALTLIRARTLTTLKRLDPDRKTILFGFLWESGLILKFSLEHLDFSGADLSGTTLNGAKLNKANLSGANLSGTTLDNAQLIRANLKGANLSRTMMYDADLRDANLTGADFTDAYLTRANIQGAVYNEEQLSKATKSEGLIK